MKKWGLVVGKWGDAIACYGNICKLVEDQGSDKINAVIYTYIPEIVPFISCQKYIGNCIHVQPINHDVYNTVSNYISFNDIPASKWFHRLGVKEVSPDEVGDTHVNYIWKNINRRPCSLPDEVLNYWRELIPKDALLVNPYSELPFIKELEYNEALVEAFHWPHWFSTIDYLKESGYKLVITGMKSPRLASQLGPNILNLVGKTRSMIDVFAIACLCRGVITTGNCLGLWSIASDTPTILVKTGVLEHNKYFNTWIDSHPNYLLSSHASFEELQDLLSYL